MRRLLHEANEARKSGDFRAAVSLCESALAANNTGGTDDASCYPLHICHGVALYNLLLSSSTPSHEEDGLAKDCRVCFRRAVTVDPTLPQAWKGLADLFEHVEDDECLAEALERQCAIARAKGNVERAQMFALRRCDALRRVALSCELSIPERSQKRKELNLMAVEVLDEVMTTDDVSSGDDVVRFRFAVRKAALLEDNLMSAMRRNIDKRLARAADDDGGGDGGDEEVKGGSVGDNSDRRSSIIRGVVKTAALKPDMDELHGFVVEFLVAAAANSRDGDDGDFACEWALAAMGLSSFASRLLWRIGLCCDDEATKARGWEHLISLCRQLARLISTAAGSCSHTEILLLAAGQCVGDVGESEGSECARALIQVLPDNVAALISLGLCDLRTGNVQSAHRRVAAALDGSLAVPGIAEPVRDAELSNLSGPSARAWLAMAQLHLDSSCAPVDAGSARRCLERAKSAADDEARLYGFRCENFPVELGTCRAKVFRALGDTDKALAVFEDLLRKHPDNTALLLAWGALCIDCGDIEGAKGRFECAAALSPNSAAANSGLGWTLYLLQQQQQREQQQKREQELPASEPRLAASREYLERAVELDSTVAETLFRLGRIYWASGGAMRAEKTFCYKYLLAAARLRPAHGPTWCCLGHWYGEVAADHTRCKRCYQKSLSLNPADGEAGEALTRVYESENQRVLMRSLWQDVVDKCPEACWAWGHLGLADLSRADEIATDECEPSAESNDLGNKALQCFQMALRTEPDSVKMWVNVASTYKRLGKHMAAFKAYSHLEELDPDETSWLCDAATVEQALGLLDEARDHLERVLAEEPCHALALNGFAHVMFGQSREYHAQARHRASMSALRAGTEAASRLLQALNEVGDPSLQVPVWKLLGDMHTFAHNLPARVFRTEGGDEGQESQLGEALLKFIAEGASAYQRVIDSNPQGKDGAAAAMYDLGLNFYQQFATQQLLAGAGSVRSDAPVTADAHEARTRAIALFRSAIRANPLHAPSWNALGAAETRPLVQQHALCRSIQIDHNPSAWGNLGMLYLRWERFDLAREAFSGLQAVAPDTPVLWVGHGLLHEGEARGVGVSPAERAAHLRQAHDAYGAALGAACSADALLGLGFTAATELQNENAIVALRQYIEQNANNAAAFNRLGLLNERAGRHASAASAFSSALSLINDQLRKEECAEAARPTRALLRVAKARLEVNLRRAHVSSGHADRANYESADADERHCANGPLWDVLMALGKSRAKSLAGDHAAAIAAADAAVARIEGDGDGTSHLLHEALLRRGLVRYAADDLSGAAASVTAAVRACPCSTRALSEQAALATVSGDHGLAMAALERLALVENGEAGGGKKTGPTLASAVLKWRVCSATCKGDVAVGAKRAVAKILHMFPTVDGLWGELARIAGDAGEMEPSLRCARSQEELQISKLAGSSVLGIDNGVPWFEASADANSGACEARELARCQLLIAKATGSRRALSRSLHIDPTVVEDRAAAVALCDRSRQKK